MQQLSKTFFGTAKDFVDAGLKLNGQMLTQSDVSTLGRLGVVQVAGEGRKPARGRTPAVFSATPSETMKFEQSFGQSLPTELPVFKVEASTATTTETVANSTESL